MGTSAAQLSRVVLVADDDSVYRNSLQRALSGRGYPVVAASTYQEACDLLQANPAPEFAIVDLQFGARSGLELIAETKFICPNVRTVLVSSYCSIATAVQAVKLGAVDCLPKSSDVDMILGAFFPDRATAMEVKVPSLAQVEWEHIHRVLGLCGGNVSAAARKLGISRRSLQRKIRRYAPPANR